MPPADKGILVTQGGRGGTLNKMGTGQERKKERRHWGRGGPRAREWWEEKLGGVGLFHPT